MWAFVNRKIDWKCCYNMLNHAFSEYYIYSKTQIFYAFFGEGKNARYNGMQGIRIEIALEYEFEAKHTIKEKGFMNGKLK